MALFRFVSQTLNSLDSNVQFQYLEMHPLSFDSWQWMGFGEAPLRRK